MVSIGKGLGYNTSKLKLIVDYQKSKCKGALEIDVL